MLKQLKNHDNVILEKTITIDECQQALKDLLNNKTPCTDGLSTEFYKHFWEEIKELVLSSFH